MADLRPRIEELVGRLAGGRGGDSGRPTSGSPPSLRPGDAGFGGAVSRLVAMPLDQFASEGQLLELRVPWHDETLWLVPDERDAEALGREGVSRGRIWTSWELRDVMALASRGVVRTVSIAKVTMDGDILTVKVRRSSSGAGAWPARS